uniref:Uncharacterized protein n=1 Tax=Peromyscus maniculatus bairdii TaxID=230844 RepID=A0A8C8W2E2_PERMB
MAGASHKVPLDVTGPLCQILVAPSTGLWSEDSSPCPTHTVTLWLPIFLLEATCATSALSLVREAACRTCWRSLAERLCEDRFHGSFLMNQVLSKDPLCRWGNGDGKQQGRLEMPPEWGEHGWRPPALSLVPLLCGHSVPCPCSLGQWFSTE